MDFTRKIAFFDIDGTLTSELDGSIPESAVTAIATARKNGHLMFINTGRCLQNLEKRFRDIGFDGYVCGCGTNIYCDGNSILYAPQSHETIMKILNAARDLDIDLIFESKSGIHFDMTRPLKQPECIRMYETFTKRGYELTADFENPNYFADKFVLWYDSEEQLASFRLVSDQYFDCIDRGGNFREFVPYGYSKATGIQMVLDYYGLPLEAAYAFGDSNNDLPMLLYVPNSVAMGNSMPESLKDQVAYVTTAASANGIENALKHFSFI